MSPSRRSLLRAFLAAPVAVRFAPPVAVSRLPMLTKRWQFSAKFVALRANGTVYGVDHEVTFTFGTMTGTTWG